MKHPVIVVPVPSPEEAVERRAAGLAFARGHLDNGDAYGPPNPRFPLSVAAPHDPIDCADLDRGMGR